MPTPEPIGRTCPHCPGHVPIVSLPLVQRLVGQLTPRQRAEGVGRAVDWLTTKHLGVDLVLGQTDILYTGFERTLITTELIHVAQLPCPFAVSGRCCLDGYVDESTWNREAEHGTWTWLPTGLLRVLNRPLLRDLLHRKMVADAKVAVLLHRDVIPIAPNTWDGAYRAAHVLTMPDKEKERAKDVSVPASVQPRSD